MNCNRNTYDCVRFLKENPGSNGQSPATVAMVVDTTTVTPPPGSCASWSSPGVNNGLSSSPAGEATAAAAARANTDGQHLLVSSTELDAGLDLCEVIETTAEENKQREKGEEEGRATSS